MCVHRGQGLCIRVWGEEGACGFQFLYAVVSPSLLSLIRSIRSDHSAIDHSWIVVYDP